MLADLVKFEEFCAERKLHDVENNTLDDEKMSKFYSKGKVEIDV